MQVGYTILQGARSVSGFGEAHTRMSQGTTSSEESQRRCGTTDLREGFGLRIYRFRTFEDFFVEVRMFTIMVQEFKILLVQRLGC